MVARCDCLFCLSFTAQSFDHNLYLTILLSKNAISSKGYISQFLHVLTQLKTGVTQTFQLKFPRMLT